MPRSPGALQSANNSKRGERERHLMSVGVGRFPSVFVGGACYSTGTVGTPI